VVSVEIISRLLPGIGVCQEIGLHDGRRVGVVTRRNGVRDIVLYDDEGDGAIGSVSLSGDEANAVAELLGAPQLVARLADLQQRANDLVTEQLPIPADSPYAGRPLGDTQARTRTGASIVAILRDGIMHPSPTPDFALSGGDLVITVGTREGVDAVAKLLDGSAGSPGAAGNAGPPRTG
jgi:K+:H+ antiporter subunit KhtT